MTVGVTGSISLIALCIAWGTSLRAERTVGRSSMRAVRIARWGLVGVVSVVIISLGYLSHGQFFAWQGNEMSKRLLPPYRSLGYFLYYVGLRMWAPYALSAAAAACAYAAARVLNRVKRGVFFEAEEPYFLAVGVFAAGHPGWMAYVMITMAAYLLFSCAMWALTRRYERVSFYRFWLPCAAVTVALELTLRHYDWYSNLLF